MRLFLCPVGGGGDWVSGCICEVGLDEAGGLVGCVGRRRIEWTGGETHNARRLDRQENKERFEELGERAKRQRAHWTNFLEA